MKLGPSHIFFLNLQNYPLVPFHCCRGSMLYLETKNILWTLYWTSITTDICDCVSVCVATPLSPSPAVCMVCGLETSGQRPEQRPGSWERRKNLFSCKIWVVISLRKGDPHSMTILRIFWYWCFYLHTLRGWVVSCMQNKKKVV